MTKVIMNGCNGKMGQTITEICKADADIKPAKGFFQIIKTFLTRGK